MNGKSLSAIAAITVATIFAVLIAVRVSTNSPLVEIRTPLGVMTLLVGVAAFWFWLEQASEWTIFNFLPPLLWIYATPIILSNTGVLPFSSGAY